MLYVLRVGRLAACTLACEGDAVQSDRLISWRPTICTRSLGTRHLRWYRPPRRWMWVATDGIPAAPNWSAGLVHTSGPHGAAGTR